MVSQGQLATAVSTGQQAVAQVLTNNFKGNNEIKIIIACDNAGGTAASNDFYLLQGAGGSLRGLPAGVTMAAGSSFATWADLQEFAKTVNFVVTGIRIIDSTTTNTGSTLLLTKHTPNGINDEVQNIEVSDYRVNNGNGISDVVKIDDVKFAADARTSLRGTILKNTTMIFYLRYETVGAASYIAE